MENFDSKDLRSRLLGVLTQNPMSVAAVSRAVGVVIPTMRAFLDGVREPAFETLCKIKKYVEQHEEQ